MLSRDALRGPLFLPFNIRAGCADVSRGSAAYGCLRRIRRSEADWDQMEVSHRWSCDFITGCGERSCLCRQHGWESVCDRCRYGHVEVEVRDQELGSFVAGSRVRCGVFPEL